MKRVLTLIFALWSFGALAAGSNIPLDKVEVDLSNQASLQKGAALYINYCMGCHSTQYQRYERVATDLGIPKELMQQNLMFDPNAKIGDLMTNTMPNKKAGEWFGVTPPDLTLVTRVRGADWVYSYLTSFYIDEKRPFGVNNRVYPNVGMPHVLEPLQGVTEAVIDESGEVTGVKVVQKGELSPQEYDQAMTDLVNFMVYSGDPVQLERHALGWKVLAFLLIFTLIAILLKKEYWRDAH